LPPHNSGAAANWKFFVHITTEQFRQAQARGCRFVPATESQVHGLAMQRRIFWLDGQAFLAIRPDGFQETAATLQSLLLRPLPPAPVPARTEAPQPEGPDEPPAMLESPVPTHAAPSDALSLTAGLVCSYLAATRVNAPDLPALIRGIHQSVLRTTSGATQERERQG